MEVVVDDGRGGDVGECVWMSKERWSVEGCGRGSGVWKWM